MKASIPDRMRDPVCGMTVTVAEARSSGLTFEHDGRVYAFCSTRCLSDFAKEPARWIGDVEVDAAPAPSTAVPNIDEGLRRWYASCRCCLHDAYPDVVAALDAERVRAEQPVSGPGICEVAEGKVPAPTTAKE